MMVIMTVSVAVLGLAASLFFLYELENQEQRISTEIDSKAVLIAANIASTLLFKDIASANGTLRTLKVDPSVITAILYDEENKFFAGFSREGYVSQIETYQLKLDGVYLEEEFVEVFRPVIIHDNRVGTVFIRSDLVELEEKIVNYSYIVMVIFLTSLILAAFLSHQLQKIITMPIQKLAQFVSQVSKDKDYSMRLDIESHDEIGVLAKEFNGMLETIEEHREKLQDQTDHLEQLVNLRSEQLHKQANYDELTGLPNRRLLFQDIEKELSRCSRNGSSFSLMFLDLDRFKTINDSLGHAVGDEILQAVATRLLQSVRKEDTVARLGGDEFVVILTNTDSREKISFIAEKIISALSVPFDLRLNSASLHVTVSIGISIYPEHGDNVDVLMRNADTSMYQAKATAPGKYMYYEEAMNVASQRLLTIENQLRDALKNKEFDMVYQPQIKLKGFEIAGVEALLRWSNSHLGAVSPAEFIPLAEELCLINEIGEWVVEQVCKQHRAWRDDGFLPVKIAVNISASQLVSINLLEHIKNMLTTYQVDGHFLEIEITEDVFLDKSERVLEQLTELKKLGIKIAIDDFGAGYSSLSYLQRIPCDVLKLDGSFVKMIGKNKTAEALVSATIILAHSLDFEMVAECVETQTQWDFLKNADCDIVQGYYYRKPLSISEMCEFMEELADDNRAVDEKENNRAIRFPEK